MTNTAEIKMAHADWYSLRDFVLDAVHSKKCSMELIREEEWPEITQLVQEYLATGKDEPIDKAVRLVAALAPGVSKETAKTRPWLVLEKS